MKVTGLPDNVTQIVNGSLPTCSVVKPWVSVTVPGTVMGSGSVQILPAEVTVTPVMVSVDVSSCQLRLGKHPSRTILAMNSAESYQSIS